MNQEEVRNIISNVMDKLDRKLFVENSKIEIKSKWHEFDNEIQKFKFLKLASGMANAVGSDSYIMYGYQERTDKSEAMYIDAKFADSKLEDDYELLHLFEKHCSDSLDINVYDFVINERKVSCVHIAPLKTKPIILKAYKSNKGIEEHRIFTRRGSNTRVAKKSEIDKMYQENREWEDGFYIEFIEPRIQRETRKNTKFSNIHNRLSLEFAVDNLSTKTSTLRQAQIQILTNNGRLDLDGIDMLNSNEELVAFNRNTLLPSKQTTRLKIFFRENKSNRNLKTENIYKIKLILNLSGGRKISRTKDYD